MAMMKKPIFVLFIQPIFLKKKKEYYLIPKVYHSHVLLVYDYLIFV